MKTEIKALVAEGKLDEALEKLVAFLESQSDQFSALDRAAKVTQSEYNQSKERELQGLLTEDQIRLANNKAVNAILEILEHMERGSSPTPSPENRNKWLAYSAGGAGIMLVIFLIFKNLSPKSNTEIPNSQQQPDTTQVKNDFPLDCPVFAENTEYGIAIFDFTTRDDSPDNADQFLVEDLDAIFNRNDFPGDATLIEGYKGLVDVPFSKTLVKNCSAKMVIWGRVFSDNTIELNFYAPDINKQQRDSLDAQLQLREQGNFQSSIKQAALIIASRVLLMNNNHGAVAEAENALREVTSNPIRVSSDNPKWKNTESFATMTLANAHLKNKQYDKSIKYYDKILDKKHQDTVALNNRFIALVKINNIEEAARASDSLMRYKKDHDPAVFEAADNELERRGLRPKGIGGFKQKADAQRLLPNQIKNLPNQ